MKPDEKSKTSPTSSRSSGLWPSRAPSTAEALEDHWLVETTPERIVWCRRQNRAYATAAQAESILTMLNTRLEPFPRSQWAIVLDARSGPIPNADPSIERVIVAWRKKLFEGFPAAAILVRTATGAMQISREAKQAGSTYGVFSDEGAARVYLTGRMTNRKRGPFGS